MVDLLYLADSSKGTTKYYSQITKEWRPDPNGKDDHYVIPATVGSAFNYYIHNTVEGYNGLPARRADGSMEGILSRPCDVTTWGIFDFLTIGLTKSLTDHLGCLSGHFNTPGDIWHKERQNPDGRWEGHYRGKWLGYYWVNLPKGHWRKIWDRTWGILIKRFEEEFIKHKVRTGQLSDSEGADLLLKIDPTGIPTLRLTDEDRRNIMALAFDGCDVLDLTQWDTDFLRIFHKAYGIPNPKFLHVRQADALDSGFLFGTGPVKEVADSIVAWKKERGSKAFVILGGMSKGGPAALSTSILLQKMVSP